MCGSGVQNLVNLMGGNVGCRWQWWGQDQRCRGIAVGGSIREMFAQFSVWQWSPELGKSNGQERWAAVHDGGVRIKGARALWRVAILKSCLKIFHPHFTRQWSTELCKSNGQEHWATAEDAVVRIEGAAALQRVAILMNKARQHLKTTLVQDLPAMRTSAYHQLSSRGGGLWSQSWCIHMGWGELCTAICPKERINSICWSFAWYRWQHEVAQVEKAGIAVLQSWYIFFTMLNVLHNVKWFPVTIFPILEWSCTLKWLKARVFALLWWKKERQTCLQHSSSNIVCCNLIHFFVWFEIARCLPMLRHLYIWLEMWAVVWLAYVGFSFAWASVLLPLQ